MQDNHTKPLPVHNLERITINSSRVYTALSKFLVIFTGLYLLSRVNYLLFHSLAELFGVVVAASIFVLAWNTHGILANGYLTFTGVAFLFIASIDILHVLAYKGMGVFEQGGANMATQLWLASRYLQAGALVVAPIFLKRHPRPWPLLICFAVVTGLLLSTIFIWPVFPTAFVEGAGITPFKLASEIIISALLLLAGALLLRSSKYFSRDVLQLLVFSLTLGVFTELAFTTYHDVYDLFNAAGHFFKIVSFFFIYKAIVETGLLRPFDLLFRDLKQNEIALREAHDKLELRVRERTAEVLETNLALQNEVAEHKLTTANLRQMQEHLEELVQARTAELEREVQERKRAEAEVQNKAALLERSNRELEDFAYIASHDLQEPLRKVKVFGERLEEKLVGQVGTEEQEMLERMVSAASRMQKMITDLLAYSRVGTQSNAKELVNLEEICADVLNDLEVRIEQTGGRVEVGPLPTLHGDPMQMRQLFINLIGNALKFHRPDVAPIVKVFVQPDAPDSPAGTSGLTTLVVEDNGIGFEQVFAPRLFQPFQRLVGRSQYEGSGVGLAICRKIVERHGGSITAQSTPGVGTRFIFTLRCDLPQ